MIFFAVNYHYVSQAPSATPRAVFPIDPAALAEQIELITASFEPVSRDRLVDAVCSGGLLPDRACMFTFDDGLQQQYELALPVFERLGCPVVFFVPGRPLAEGRALNVHRIHRLREELGDDEVLALVAPHLEDGALASIDLSAAAGMYRYDTPEAAGVKYLLNVVLRPERAEQIVAAAFRDSFGDETGFVRELYMGAAEVAELEQRGMLGAHAHSHLPLARLGKREQRQEFEWNLQALEQAAGRRPRIVSYPYGSRDAVDSSVAALAAAAGFIAGFTMERAFNRSLEQPLLLARLDCVDAPGGRRPLFEAPDPFGIGSTLTAARERYFDEAALVSSANASP